jgi:hypothetical protein
MKYTQKQLRAVRRKRGLANIFDAKGCAERIRRASMRNGVVPGDFQGNPLSMYYKPKMLGDM